MNSLSTYKDYRKRIVVLVGVHGCGKTFLGRMLEKDGFRFFPEIGTEMRKDSNKNVGESQNDFDSLILERESKRDSESVVNSVNPIIETWHIGNYAFAITRGSIIDGYGEFIDNLMESFYPLILHLKIDDKTFIDRNTEKNISPQESLAFYRCLDKNLTQIIDGLSEDGKVEVLEYFHYQYEDIKNVIYNFMNYKETN